MDGVQAIELQGVELWRRQCARNLMDCYALAMEVLSGGWEAGRPGYSAVEALTRLMVDGMTAVRTEEDRKSIYKSAARLCRECAPAVNGKGGLFRVYAAIFDDMSGEEGL